MNTFSLSRFAISRLPAIPVIVLGLVLALLLLLSWNHQNAGQAEAGVLDGTLNVTFEAKGALDSALMTGLCIDIRDGFNEFLKFEVCDGDALDENPADGAIGITLDFDNPFLDTEGLYSIHAQTVKDTGNGFELDPAQQPGDGDEVRECNLFFKDLVCDITYS